MKKQKEKYYMISYGDDETNFPLLCLDYLSDAREQAEYFKQMRPDKQFKITEVITTEEQIEII